MNIVFSLKHKNVLESPGVLTDVLINCGLNDTMTTTRASLLGNRSRVPGLPRPDSVARGEAGFDRRSDTACAWRPNEARPPADLLDPDLPPPLGKCSLWAFLSQIVGIKLLALAPVGTVPCL